MSPARPVILVTGLSGAGKASLLRALEDLGYETVDNPPLAVLEDLIDPSPPAGPPTPLAAGIDARSRGFTPDGAIAVLDRLRARRGVAVTLVYMTADEAVLQRRYTETRRRHPLAGPDGTVRAGIAREAALLAPFRDAADQIIDTSELAPPELRRRAELHFALDRAGPGAGLAIRVVSFAFPRGLPREADLVFDLRFLRNPHYDPRLRPRTGLDPEVAAHIEADPDFVAFWHRLVGFLEPLLPRFVAEGKKYLTVAVGCTGGRHRSVLVAERLADHLRGSGWRAEPAHRELAAPHIAPAPGDAVPAPGLEALPTSP